MAGFELAEDVDALKISMTSIINEVDISKGAEIDLPTRLDKADDDLATFKENTATSFTLVSSELENNLTQISNIKAKQINNTLNTFGTYATATVSSLIANGAGNNLPQVLGITLDGDSGLALYPDRDSVVSYRANQSHKPLVDSTSVTYTVNSVICSLALDLSQVLIGMIIDTHHTPKYSGIITAINGNIITVNNWYQIGNTAKGQIPPNTFGIMINPVTKIWGDNVDLFLNVGDPEIPCSMVEYDLINNQSTASNKNGIDMMSMGNIGGDAGFMTRNSQPSNLWNMGFFDNGSKASFVGGSAITTDQLLQNTVTGFSISNDGKVNREKHPYNHSGLTTLINPEASPVFLLVSGTTCTIRPASECPCDIVRIFNVTPGSPVLITGTFINPTQSGSITIPPNSMTTLFSDGANWYHS